jgi:hypothetical protein
MAVDQLTLNSPTVAGGDKIAVDRDADGADHQYVKVEFGAQGTRTPVDSSNPFPVTVGNFPATQPVSGPLTDAQLRATAVPVSAASLPLPTGAATETTLAAVLTQSDFDTKAGALTEAAPATDTASSGLNGRLQRIAQRLTSLIALLPAALGAGGGLKIDGSGTALPVTINVPTTPSSGKTTVTTAGTRVALAGTTTIKSVTIKALITNTGLIYVGSSAVASTNGFQLSAGDSVSLDISDPSVINIDSDVNGEGVTYITVN